MIGVFISVIGETPERPKRIASSNGEKKFVICTPCYIPVHMIIQRNISIGTKSQNGNYNDLDLIYTYFDKL
jgi:hypothetical protein